MEITDLVGPGAVLPRLKATSKKQALNELSILAASKTGLNEREIFDVLLERERLGTTGVGQGVAIPHGRFAGIDKIYGFFARLDQPVDYDSVDDRPVDLLFMLMAPEDAGADHLKALARVSRLLRDKEICDKLRGADSGDALYVVLTEDAASEA